MSQRRVATVEARMASSRLPGKILKNILGKSSLERLVERVRRSRLIDEVVVATTINPQDDAVETWAKKTAVSFYRGSEEDVLLRVLEAAKAFQADIIVELTGDCPLLDPVLIDQVIEKYLHSDYDYVSNNKERSYARGFDAQVFSVKVLDEVSRLTKDPADHEHVSLYIYEHPERYKLFTLWAPERLHAPDLRLCVDTPEDFFVVESIYKALYPKKPDFDAEEIMNFIKQHPEIAQVNSVVKQKPARMP